MFKQYILHNDTRYLSKINKTYEKNRLEDVRFIQPHVSWDEFERKRGRVKRCQSIYGDTEYFIQQLCIRIGDDWEKKVFSRRKVDTVGIKRLGIPGHQGTTIRLMCGSRRYAIKLIKKCGCAELLKQARMQQLASEYNITCPVYAAYSGNISFIAMPMLEKRLVDVYKEGDTLSRKHQTQLFNITKKLDEEAGILHNDSNCLNIMIDSSGNLKYIDFDLSKMRTSSDIKRIPYHNLWNIQILDCFLPTKYRHCDGIHIGSHFIDRWTSFFNVDIPKNWSY